MLDMHDIIYVLRLITGASQVDAAGALPYYICGPFYRPVMSLSNLHSAVGRAFCMPSEAEMIAKKCKYCRRTFQVYPSHSSAKFCSVQCREWFHTGPLPLIRQCTRCKGEFPATLEYFGKSKGGKGGLTAYCRDCIKDKRRTDWKRDGNAVYEYSKQYRLSHPEWTKQAKKRHYEKHRDQVIEKSRQYRQNNPDYWRRTPPKEAAKSAARKARKCNAPGTYTAEDVLIKLENQRGRCFYCHKLLNGVYQVDHYIPLSKGGSNWPSNLVIACSKCNRTKGDRMPVEFVERYILCLNIPNK